jgi:hypothetical protein
MHALMGEQQKTSISDDKVQLKITDNSRKGWQAKIDNERKEQLAEDRARELHWRQQHVKKITIKPNHGAGIPPLTLERAEELLQLHFSHVSDISFVPQSVNGVPVMGAYTHYVSAWVGPPLGGGSQAPPLIRDNEVKYAQWEYYFAVPDQMACKRCHQTWTACAEPSNWKRCAAHLYFQRQHRRQQPDSEEHSRAPPLQRRSRHALTTTDLINSTPALSRARARAHRR